MSRIAIVRAINSTTTSQDQSDDLSDHDSESAKDPETGIFTLHQTKTTKENFTQYSRAQELSASSISKTVIQDQ